MRFREIRTRERIERITYDKQKQNEEEGYKKIKPETDMTIEEANAFIENLFSSNESIMNFLNGMDWRWNTI